MYGKKIKHLRTNKEITQSDLAKVLNVTPKAVSFYENDQREPSAQTLITIAEYFNVSSDYLLGLDNVPSSNTKSSKFKRINIYGSVPAGIPIEAVEDIIDFEDISMEEFSATKEYIGLIVKGDSMYPKYLEGDIVIVELTPTCESGTDAVVYVNGYEATLKTFIKNIDGSITLKPLNTAYPPVTYGKDDDPISVLGIVKQIRRNV